MQITITTMLRNIAIDIQDYKRGNMKEDLSKAIYLLDNITANMEWMHDLVMKRLEEVKEIVKSNLNDKNIDKASLGYAGDQNSPIPIKEDNPLYCDSVGTEELK